MTWGQSPKTSLRWGAVVRRVQALRAGPRPGGRSSGDASRAARPGRIQDLCPASGLLGAQAELGGGATAWLPAFLMTSHVAVVDRSHRHPSTGLSGWEARLSVSALSPRLGIRQAGNR